MSGFGSDALEMEDGPRMMAAEYVLGTLDVGEVAEADARRQGDPAFAAEIRFWEERLYPLTLLVVAIPPPASLWARIEDTASGAGALPAAGGVGASRPANDNAVQWWRAAAVAGMAVAASLVAFIALRPAPTFVASRPVAAPIYAVLTPAGSTAGLLVAVAQADGSILVRPSGSVAVASGRDLELWALVTGATKPASLGVLPASGKRLVAGMAAGTKLLVSLEPQGGSPTGQPTGPVVYGGTLQPLD